MANYLSAEKRVQIFHLLCEGNGITGISRLTGCSKQTVSLLMARYYSICDYLNRKLIQQLDIAEIEADEIRTFVRVKTNIKWIYVALDRDSRMIINFHIGSRDTHDAKIFLQDLSHKLSSKAKVSTDCLKSYISAVAKTPNGRIDSAINSIGLLRAADYKRELKRSITNRIETHNGNIRQHVSRLTRKTRCFSKSEERLKQHLTLFFFYYNFIKVHTSLKTTPAVFAEISDKPFTFDVLIDYDNMFTENPGKRGTYKKIKKEKVAKIVSIDKDFITKVSGDIEGARLANGNIKSVVSL